MTSNLYWGDLHSHCSVSYGHGSVAQALARARQQLDFCSITGHAFWPDMPTDRARYGPIIDYHQQGFAALASNWSELLAQQKASTLPGEFIAFPSYEWHSRQFGDHNVYAMEADLPLVDAPHLPALRDVVNKTGGIAIPHHIGYRAGYRGIDWSEYRADCSPFVEVFSLHGCSVSDDAPYPMLHEMGPRDFGSTAEAGWQLGHRFGIVGGTDHHAAYPGSHGDGRMGVFAENLTREGLWEALRNRRVYAATGDRIDARMFVDDAWIGESIQSASSRHVRAIVQGADTIDKVELVKNGRVIERFFPPAVEVSNASRVFRLRLTWGWGRQKVPIAWQGRLALSAGTLKDVETCFAGQAVVAPQTEGQAAAGDTELLPHALLERDDSHCAWRSITQGNETMRHETTQALSLEIEAPLDARLTVEVNGQRLVHTLSELLHTARSHFLNGLLSEAIRIGPLIPIEACQVSVEFTDLPERDVDVYRLQVAQRNGQCAWLTPIWVER